MTRTVVHFTDTAAFGGAERVLLTILAGLDRRRWRPVLLHHDAPGVEPLVREARALDVPTRTVPPWRRRTLPGWLLGCARQLRDERASVFHAHLTWARRCRDGLGAAMLARVPAIVATQQLFAGIRSLRARWSQKLLFLGVDRYLAVSADMSRALASTCFLASRKVRVVRNGVPVASGHPRPDPSVRIALAGSPDRPIVLTLARLDPQKGLDSLVDAAAHVPDAVFAIAGEGDARDALQSRAHRLGIAGRVRFLGHRDDTQALLANADVFVLPSLYEGLPVSVLEAMAAEVPVVATAIPGTDEVVVDGETGILIPPRDPLALAGAVRTLLDDPARRARLAAAAAARVREEFSADAMVKRIESTYDELLGANGRGHGHV